MGTAKVSTASAQDAVENLLYLARRLCRESRNCRLPPKVKTKDRLDPIHPGDVLLEEFMKPLDLSTNKVGRAIGVSPRAISQIFRRKRAVKPEMALKLGRCFKVSPELW